MDNQTLYIGIIVVLLSIIALVLVPVWRARSFPKVEKGSKQFFEIENATRKTLAQILGGAILLASAYQAVQSYQLSRQAQIADRLKHGLELLAAKDDPALQIAGIYRLERVAREAKGGEPARIRRLLSWYVREHASSHQAALALARHEQKWRDGQVRLRGSALNTFDWPPPTVQASLEVLVGKPSWAGEGEVLDLSFGVLAGAKLRGGQFQNANLTGVDFQGGVFGIRADDTSLVMKTDLARADFSNAQLVGALFEGANLTDAVFHNSCLVNAGFLTDRTTLRGADFAKATLDGALFFDVDLEGADFQGASLRGSQFHSADLTATNLSEEQLRESCTDKETTLPDTVGEVPTCEELPRSGRTEGLAECPEKHEDPIGE